ncbi:purine-cytosine permease family protein [Sporobolomyces salmoneus]|uniref:purine-cytosine permease family protein n=1 Tax=Sporobolomyces salmoneus TaxID=183962 RepID=UPI003173154E
MSRRASMTSTPNSDSKLDLEKQTSSTQSPTAHGAGLGSVNVADGDVVAATGPFAKLNSWFEKIGFETRSLERVPEDQRDHHLSLFQIIWRQMFFWFSVNLSFSCLGTGFLGSLYFTLDFPTSMAVITCGTALGCTVSATTAILGPRYGLRTMALSRFAGGFIGTGIFSVLNALTQIAYAVTAALVAAQALRAINHGLSLTVGIVISTIITLVVCVGGYRILHYWERYAWIACFIIYLIILGLGTRGNYDVHAKTADMDSGKALVGDVLSFFGIMFSVGSDYNMTLPSDTPAWPIWIATYFGTWLPIFFTCSVSASFAALTKDSYATAFEEESLGGVVGEILKPAGGFGKFLLVVLCLSVTSANTANTYSGALCLQSLHPILMKVPRIFFVILFTAVYLVLAIVGKDHYSKILGDFSAILAYYTAFFSAILFMEVFWFRRKNGPIGPINADHYADYKKLAPGYACLATILCCIPLIVVSMSQTWFVGPVALAVTEPESSYGADIGFELAYAMAILTYPIFRTIEIRYYKR